MGSNLICMPGDPGYVEPGSPEYAKHLGCSEVAAVLGFDQWGKTANDVWLSKTHRAPATEHKRIFDRGHAMEPLMASMLAVDHGRLLKCEQVQYRHPDYPWLIYHADGMFSKWTALEAGAKQHEGPGIWEAKAPGSRQADNFLKDGMSSGYVCQTQIGMLVASAAMGIPIEWSTAGFLDYDAWELVPFDIGRSEKFQDESLAKLVEFWACKESDTPPTPINPVEAEHPPEIDGTMQFIDDEEIARLATDLAAIAGPLSLAKATDKHLRDQIKDLVGSYSQATVSDILKFTYRFNKPSEKIDGPGLLVYCEELVKQFNALWEVVPLCDRPDSAPVDYTDFRRTDWVTPKAGTRTFKPTFLGE